ncbi:innexin inx2-like [Ornithodoros turicata]|uniref:innexin inx2-like n=1 Tax=Ornithodoros turicata TaxID=34597 RepID=UPI00313A1210
MDQAFGRLKYLIKIETVVIDNHVFRLHYKVTVALLLAFTILVTSRQYIGDPIDCISKDSVPNQILDTFCWIHSTFSVTGAWDKKVGVQIPYPGVDTYTPGDARVYHGYYQWVCFVLFLQAVLFYAPRYLWTACEGRKIETILLDLNSPVLGDDKREPNRKLLLDYLVNNMGYHKVYTFHYFLCEVLNFVNVIGQIYLMDEFLGGEFTTYGTKVLEFTEWDWDIRYDPMIRVFPRLTKCTFYMHGSSGDVQKYDAICILPINVINEKIYVFLWFWFVILSVPSGLAIIYRSVLLLWPAARFHVLKLSARLANSTSLERVLKRCDVGEWFLLDLLAKNMDPVHYRDLISDLEKQMECQVLMYFGMNLGTNISRRSYT